MVQCKLHILIAKHRISQKELSEKTGIRRPTIGEYCRDTFKTISREHIDILCNFFNCKIDDLIEYVPDENNK
ncbi:MAG: helix-turn-helix domain-containing protein [Clostridium chrysemydis]|uniref:helix-turn-helix domain-containing protein n=1 Tax=Clostridium chrysemydis TaxID=2665504 RepID=UPI003F3A59D5